MIPRRNRFETFVRRRAGHDVGATAGDGEASRTAAISARWGKLKLKRRALQNDAADAAVVSAGGKNLAATLKRDGKRIRLTLTAGEKLEIILT